MKEWNDAAGRPIGVFDSGIGGLSVLREMLKALPGERFIYFADRARMPYGERRLEEVADFSRAVTRFFLAQNVKLIVIACNTASAAALHPLRAEYPEMLFVGMEPAVKPAAENTVSGKVGVLATAGTFRGAPYAGVVNRFAHGVQVLEQPCTGLAAMIEHCLPAESIREKLRGWLAPLREAGIDQLALACTHYPLILPLIKEIAGEEITVIDPSPAVARQAGRLLESHGLRQGGAVTEAPLFFSSAEPEKVTACVRHYLSLAGAAVNCEQVTVI